LMTQSKRWLIESIVCSAALQATAAIRSFHPRVDQWE
jgi:hypothetical protein